MNEGRTGLNLREIRDIIYSPTDDTPFWPEMIAANTL